MRLARVLLSRLFGDLKIDIFTLFDIVTIAVKIKLENTGLLLVFLKSKTRKKKIIKSTGPNPETILKASSKPSIDVKQELNCRRNYNFKLVKIR